MEKLKLIVIVPMMMVLLAGISYASDSWPDTVMQKINVLYDLEKDKKDMPLSIEEAPVVSGEEAYTMWKSKKAVILDTRSKTQYDTERITGSENLYADELIKDPSLAQGLDKEKAYILYCNGIKCTRSPKAAILMNHLGFKKIYWYREGIPDWKSKGYPTE
ncbi:MAG: rhodanese-like domain-containing protein [Nitrospiraceae bacterium]|nr:MAG: rhodanese-like domain-containing protein [Nitrospiraceae bacterium]